MPSLIQTDHLPSTALRAVTPEMRTEISAKFRRAGLTQELAAAGFEVTSWWQDPAGDFALALALPSGG